MKNHRARTLLIVFPIAVIIPFLTVGFGHTETTYASSTKFSVGNINLSYKVIWNLTLDEEITMTYKIFGPVGGTKSVKRHNAAGLNICTTADHNIIYGFLKDTILRIDPNQHTMDEVKEADISNQLSYLGRLEATEIRDSSHEGKIGYIKAPDTGTGPKDPCKLY